MKKRIFLDTNIILDLLGERDPFYKFIAQIATLADQRKIVIVCSPLSIVNINYILFKSESPNLAITKLRKFKIICEICKIDESIVEKGLNSKFNDFEDSLQYFCAIDSKCDIIITRNAKDFKSSLLPIMTAKEYLESLK